MTTARPILFSAPMVRALLEGRKTQTRRILKDVPEAPGIDEVVHANPKHTAPYLDAYCGGRRTPENPRGMTQWWCWWTRDDRPCEQFKIPYGAPGDLLWVRETFLPDPPADHPSWDEEGLETYVSWSGCGGEIARIPAALRNPRHVLYRATWQTKHEWKWRPCIHMPRWASRLTLEITGVKVERLQDISEADAKAEGCGPAIPGELKEHPLARHVGPNPLDHFAALWEGINGWNGPGSWDANPWVVALSFKVHTQNVDAVLATLKERHPGEGRDPCKPAAQPMPERGCGSAPEAQTKKRGCGPAPEAQLKSEPAP